jgi:hypothetical protein
LAISLVERHIKVKMQKEEVGELKIDGHKVCAGQSTELRNQVFLLAQARYFIEGICKIEC